MQVDRAVVHRRVGARRLGLAEQLARGDVDDRKAVRRGRAQRDFARRVAVGAARNVAVAGELVLGGARAAPAGASRAQLSRAHQLLRIGLPARAEVLCVLARERALVRGAAEMRRVDQRALVVEDRRLDGAVEELVGVATEELIERVLAGDVHRQAAPPAPRASPHLAKRRDGAREGHDDRRVELADVDAELQRVGRDHRAQLAAHQAALELASLLGGVAGPVGHHQLGQLGARVAELLPDQPAQQLYALARLHEADRARAFCHQAREQLRRLAERRAPRAGDLVRQRRIPHRDPPRRRRRSIVVDQRDRLQAGEALGQLAPGLRSSPTSAESAAGCRRRRRSVAAGAARWRRASRRPRGRRAPRRSRPRRGWRRGLPTRRGWAGCRRAACPGWSARGWRPCGSARAPGAACRRRRSPGARAWSGRTSPARAPGPARAPSSDTRTGLARARLGRARRASAG